MVTRARTIVAHVQSQSAGAFIAGCATASANVLLTPRGSGLSVTGGNARSVKTP